MNDDTLANIAKVLGQALAPIAITFSSEQEFELFLARSGWDAHIENGLLSEINTEFDLTDFIKDIIDNSRALVHGEKKEKVKAGKELIEQVKGLTEIILRIKEQLFANLSGIFPFDQAEFWEDFADRMVDGLLITYLEDRYPILFAILHLLGTIRFDRREPDQPGRIFYTHAEFDWEALFQFIFDPRRLADYHFPWRQEVRSETSIDYSHEWSVRVLERAMQANRLPVRVTLPSEGLVDYLGIPLEKRLQTIEKYQIRELDIPLSRGFAFDEQLFWDLSLHILPIYRAFSPDKPPDGLLLLPVATNAGNVTFKLNETLKLKVKGDIPESGLALKLFADGVEALTEGAPSFSISLEAAPAKPWVFIGSEEGSRLELDGFAIKAAIKEGKKKPELRFELGTDKHELRLVLSFGNGDSFLQKAVGGQKELKIGIDANLLLSTTSGIRFEGGGKFEVVKWFNKAFGPLEIQQFYLGLITRFGTEKNALDIDAAVGLKLKLGPFTAIIERVGLRTSLLPAADTDKGAKLGKLGIEFGFKPPNGIALSLETSTVTGGGYIAFYPEEERYYGALSLSFKDQFTFSAIGIIETRLPDDPDGFSMLLLVNVEFTPALSLGMNFYLAGLGGIIGLHRTINIDALRDGVKEDTVDQVMFPDNPIENITGIIQNLENFFPPQKGQFFFGVMALISWNTPPLLTIEAGIIIEFNKPTRLVIIGILRCLLPKPEKALVQLNVNLLGVIDFNNKFLSFDASIFDSRIASITLEGGMAFRLSWGKQKAFLLSIGGFHPAYTPPTQLGIKPMKRLTMNLLGSDNPSLILTTYFAITSNTVQFGAQIDLFIKIKKFSIYGFFGFDVLFQFSPFRFIANVRAGLEIKWGSKTLFGIRLEFELSGPGPWVAKGVAKFSILFITIKVRFKKTIGKKREAFLPSIQALSLLKEELDKPENWKGSLPDKHFPLVVLRESQVEEGVVLMDAFGALSIEQQAMPLNSTIDKIGNYAPEGLSRASISRITILGQEQPAEFLLEAQNGLEKGLDSLRQAFAPAAYKQLSIDERLAAQDFVDMDSGVQLRTGRLRGGNAKKRLMAYETPPNPSPDKSLTLDLSPPQYQGMPASIMSRMANNGAISYSRLARVIGNRPLAPLVELRETPYTIVDTTTLARSTQVNFTAGTRVEAEEQLRRTLAGSPQLKEALRVVPVFETEL